MAHRKLNDDLSTLRARYAVSEDINKAVSAASLAIEYLKVWRALRVDGKKPRRVRYKLKDARRELRDALACVRKELAKTAKKPNP